MIVGYVAVAGIAVTLIGIHYIFAYRPNLDPFRDINGVGCPRTVPFRSNPVDLVILRGIKKPFRGFRAVKVSSSSRWSYLDARLTKCILAMSDLQLATGLALLISGYTQLPCGLSVYHWSIISRLAWFSSLTHLSCLTLLRNYLHNNRAERQWRLLFMLILVIMLVTAMASTGGAGLADPASNEYAICSFSIYGHREVYVNRFGSMIILICLVLLGFVFRVIKLYRPVSLFVVENLRRHISHGSRKLLWGLYRWSGLPRGPRSFAGSILYYPALAWFLSMRLVADHFASMFFEVYWLPASFLIGLFSLLQNLNILMEDNYWDIDTIDNSWSFGQVVPVILLAVPLINIFETFHPATSTEAGVGANTPPSSPSNSTTNSLFLIAMRPSTPPIYNRPEFDPDRDYYNESTAMGAATVYILIYELVILGFSLYAATGSTLYSAVLFMRVGLAFPPIGLWATILVSLSIDRFGRGKGRKWRVGALQIVNVACMTSISLMLVIYLSHIWNGGGW